MTLSGHRRTSTSISSGRSYDPFDTWAENSGFGCRIHDYRRARSGDILPMIGTDNPSSYYPTPRWLPHTKRLDRRTGHAL